MLSMRGHVILLFLYQIFFAKENLVVTRTFLVTNVIVTNILTQKSSLHVAEVAHFDVHLNLQESVLFRH